MLYLRTLKNKSIYVIVAGVILVGLLLFVVYKIYNLQQEVTRIKLEKERDILCGSAQWYKDRAPEWWLEQTKKRYEFSLTVTDTNYFITKIYSGGSWAENNCLKSSGENLITCFNESNNLTAEVAFRNWKEGEKNLYERAIKQLDEYKKATENCEAIKKRLGDS